MEVEVSSRGWDVARGVATAHAGNTQHTRTCQPKHVTWQTSSQHAVSQHRQRGLSHMTYLLHIDSDLQVRACVRTHQPTQVENCVCVGGGGHADSS